MQQPRKITEYLEIVRQQIRWKRAQSFVLDEISDHITDQKNAFMDDGLNEEEATDKAILEMGDPVIVGEQLDRAHRPRPDWLLISMAAAMLLFGLAVQTWIGPNHLNNGAEMFQKQIIWAGIGIIVMFVGYFLDFTIIGKYPKVIFFGLCTITLASYLYEGHRMASATIYLLLLFPIAFAGFVYSMRNQGYGGFIFCMVVSSIPAYLSIFILIYLSRAPYITVLFLICISCLIILTVAVKKGWFNVRKLYAIPLMFISTAVVLSSMFIMMPGKEYIKNRILVMLNPLLDPTGSGYIWTVVHHFLSHAQFVGQGLPISGYSQYSSLEILPEVNTDFVLTYLIYRLGWIVLIGIILIFSVFIVRAILLCKKQKGVLGFFVSLAIISTFTVQCMVYINYNLGLPLMLPPVSLPLISYGGRALVTNMFLIGILFSVFRTGDLVRDRAEDATGTRRFIQFVNGQIIINIKTR
ncbi:FtsW/RodA/SpoVE family cell cycle protein [Desulfitobacterium sp. Sab5]|uniref:FtsW/RodA/SpoVE family cell cycle protein n=1 Tax=Desulfitobacterium nosdiversum TaxID=3375356 RepID=UPI003CF19B6E